MPSSLKNLVESIVREQLSLLKEEVNTDVTFSHQGNDLHGIFVFKNPLEAEWNSSGEGLEPVSVQKVEVIILGNSSDDLSVVGKVRIIKADEDRVPAAFRDKLLSYWEFHYDVLSKKLKTDDKGKDYFRASLPLEFMIHGEIMETIELFLSNQA